MAYEIPTAADLKTRYPAFDAVADATVVIHIADAAGSGVDTSWSETDYAPAIAALAAHNMALLNLGEHGEAAGYLASGMTSIRSGNFSAQFSADRARVASGGGFDATPYGRTYKVLLRRNRGGPRVVGAALTDDYWSYRARQNNGVILP